MTTPSTENQPQAQSETPSAPKARLAFDKAAIAKMRESISELFVDHPEVRSVAVVFDYEGGLNDADIDKGLWLGTAGTVVSPAAIFGSIHNTMLVLEQMFVRASRLEQNMRDRYQLLASELLEKQKNAEQNGDGAAGAVEHPAGSAHPGT